MIISHFVSPISIVRCYE